MPRRLLGTLLTAAVMSTLMLEGCATSGTKIAGPAGAANTAAFDRLKSLEGEWESVDEQGQKQVAAVFSVTSAGSAVREVMFPGLPHEMTNMYHLDGDSLIATHYCAAGNQPRMRCASAVGGTYAFVFDDITNLTKPDAEHMADLTLVVIDDTHVRQVWESRRRGAKTEQMVFELTRKQ